jgi:hypothetical protein
MSNANKAKGTRWESAIVTAFGEFFGRRWGLHPYRPAQAGAKDVGDIHGVSPFVLQAKDDKSHDFSGWLDGPRGVTVQAANAGEHFGAVIVKRPRRPVGAAYAVMRAMDLARLIVRLRRAERLLDAFAPEAYDRHAAECAADLEREFPR